MTMPTSGIALKQSLELEGLSVRCHTGAQDIGDLPLRSLYGVIVSDIRMPGMDGLALMRHILGVDPTLPVVLITGHGDVQMPSRRCGREPMTS
jgi:two-component system C4-dicarboxylate transport response regulator DctD